MADVPLSAIGKGIGLVVRPVFRVVRQQWARRGAEEITTSGPATVDRELSEAISVLLGEGATLPEHLWVWIKGLLSDPPIIFEYPEAKDWLRREDVQATLKDAALALATDQPLDTQLAEAKRLYGVSADEADWYGEPLFTYAVSFLSLSLKAKISVDTRLLLEAGNRRARHIDGRFDEVQHAVAETNARLADWVDRQESAVEMPVDAIDLFVETELRVRERSRAITRPDPVGDATALGRRAFDGDLRSAGDAIRSALFRFVAATEAREGSADEADTWIARAAQIGANDLAPDRARIALARHDWDGAIAALDRRTDRLSVSLQIDAIQRRDGKAASVAYFDDFSTPDGVTGFFLSSMAHWCVDLGRIEDAEVLLDAATAEQLEENPLLHFTRMRVRLALCAGPDQRSAIVQSPGLLPHPSTLRDDAEGGRLLRQALRDLQTLLPILHQLRQPDFVSLVEYFEQYLALASLDPATTAPARTRLKSRLEDAETVAAFSPLARLFGVDFDRATLRSQLDQSARLGPWDDTQLRAALDLAVHDRDPDLLVTFIDAHRDRLVDSSGAGQTVGLQVEALARTGRLVDARAKLAASEALLTPNEVQLLSDIIAECEGQPSLDLHLARFAASDDERDLMLLVDALRDAADRRLADFAALLWRRRHRIEDALNAANGFVQFGRDAELERFLEELGTTVSLDDRLQAHQAWMLYRRGDLPAATALLAPLRLTKPNDAGLRQLEINIAIEYGDWHQLTQLIRSDLEHADDRSAFQLLQAGGLAHAANNPDVMLLLRAAVAKAPDDPVILLNAYEVALRGGEDTTDEVSGWLMTAIACSGENGPVQGKRLSNLIALRDDNMRRATELDGLIMSGQVTLATAAKPLGTTLSALVLDRIRANSTLTDPRQRLCLPFFAGNRVAHDLKGVNRIALDPSAILLLHLTGMLEKTFAAFEQVVIPAGTLPSLFEDLRRADRGQPSRAVRAAQIKRLAAEHILECLNDLDTDGRTDDVDILFAAAETLNGSFVHAPPLHVVGTMLEEVRDPAPFSLRLLSPAGILVALFSRGELTATEMERAKWLPSFAEQWPEEPAVRFDRPLILDGVALHHLVDADLIHPLRRAGARLYIRSQVLEIADREIEERESIQRLSDAIEAVRATIHRALTAGKACIGPSRRSGAPPADGDEEDEDDRQPDPLRAVLQDAGEAEVLVSDERVVNRFGGFTDASTVDRPIATSLDVIDALVARKSIAPAARAEALQLLRSSGISLIPVTADEIVASAQRGDWTIGPSRELKAIRDSIQLPLLRRAVHLPDERHWLESTTLQMGLAIKRCYRDLDGVEDAETAAEFLFASVPDLRSYVQADPQLDSQAWAQAVILGFHSLIASPLDVPFDRLDAYHRWYERSVFERLRGRDHDLFDALLGRLRETVLEDRTRIDFEVPEGQDGPTREQIARWILGHLPDVIANKLLEEPKVRSAIGQNPPDVLDIEGAHISQGALLAFLQSVLAGAVQPLVDAKGVVFAEAGTINPDGSISITLEKTKLRFEAAGLLSSDHDIRVKAVKSLLSSRTLDFQAERDWMQRAETGPLSAEDFIALTKAVNSTAEGFMKSAQGEITDDDFTMPDIVPAEEGYFRSLFAPGATAAPLDAMIMELAEGRRDAVDQRSAAIAAAPLAVAPGFDINDFIADFDVIAAIDVARALIDLGDPFSLLAAFQIICRHLDDDACRQSGDALIESLWGEATEIEARVQDFCAGAMLSLSMPRWRGQLRNWPIQGRRLVLLAHAGHVARVLRLFDVKRPELLEQVRAEVGAHYQLAGLLERGEAIEWQYSWLTPQVINGYLLRRFDQVLDTLTEEARPTAWIATLTRVVKTYEDGQERLLLGLPGPLDEFSPSGPGRVVMPPESYAEFIDMLDKAEPPVAINLLFIVKITFSHPEETDLVVLGDIIERQLGMIEEADWDQAIDVALMFAGKWRTPELAERLFAQVLEKERPMRQIVERAIAMAAAHADPEERNAALGRHMAQLAFATTDPLQAGRLVRAIEAVTNCEPSLAAPLSRARTSALLVM